jgi:leucine dehydrogenase
VAIVGVGSVGGRLAQLLAEAGAELVLADIDERRRDLGDRLGARWTDPESALFADVDVLAPCALGGVLSADTVPHLRARAIAGAANNQLADETVAAQLAERDILWVPDFVANAGGVVNISVELEPEGYDAARAETRVRAVGDTVRTVLDHAESAGVTPLAAANEIARRRVAEAQSPAAA